MLRTCFIACAINLVLGVQFTASAEDGLFEKGLAAYQNKQYTEARDDFQKLVEENHVSAALLHNLALTYFQLDQAPLSLALWRKALTIEPGFRPARSGRDFAELKLQTRGFERDRLSETLQRNLEFISFFESLWLIALVAGIAGWLWIRYIAARRQALEEESPRPPFPATAAGLSALLAFCIGLSVMKLNLTLMTRATVVSKKAAARSLPTAEGVPLFELNGGSEVLIRQRDKEWSQVQNSEGASGWVSNAELFVTSQR